MELNQNRSLDNLALWLTSPYSVANIQKFFGIRKLKSNEIDDGDEQQGGKGVTSNGIGSGLSDHGSPWRSRLKDAAENHQQHVDYVVDNWLWYGIFRIGALLGDDVFYYTFMPFWFYNVNGIVMRKVALIWAIVMYVGQTSKEFGAFLGDDAFYYTFVPFWFFNINSFVIRRVLLLWALFMYIGQSSKEILKWPRPQSPPVVPLEPRYFKEYGMPSTHAMVGTLIPFSILFLTMDKVEYSIPMGFLVATAWMLLVCFSRLYKGMHYILDVLVGVVLTFALLGMVFPVLDKVDHYLMTDRQAPLLLASIVTFLSLTYPSQRGWSSTREDTIVILSVTGSIYTSLWLNNHFQWYPDRYNDDLPHTITWPSLAQWGAMFCREFIGVTITLLAHCIIKPVMLEILSFVYSIEINSETRKWLSVEFPYKYVTYTLVVLFCMLVSPLVFTLVGL